MCPKIIERWEAEPLKGFQIPHRDFALSVKQSLQCMVVFTPLTTSPPSKSLQVCPGTQGGYHAANRWDIFIQPIRSVTLLRGTVIQRGAGGPGRALFIPFAPAGYRSRMLTVEPESVTELMNSVPVMPSELLAEGAAVGSPLGTEDSLNFSPLDEGSEESAPAEAIPATDPVPAPQEEDMADAPADGEPAPPPQSAAQKADPVPAPQEEDMPEAPADAEERPAAPADADALQSAAEEDVLTRDAIPQPVCFVSQAAQPLDPPLPYMGDILMVSITWHTRNTSEYTGKKGGFGTKGYVACTGGYECIMHNACIGGLGNTSSLPIMMINVVFENTPFWALGVYGRILKAPIPQYTAVYSGVYGRILRVYGRILGVFVCTTWLFQVEKFHCCAFCAHLVAFFAFAQQLHTT